MATINLKLSPVRKDSKHSLLIQIIHARKHRTLNSGIIISKEQWDSKNNRVIKHENKEKLNDILLTHVSIANKVILEHLMVEIDIDSLVSEIKEKISPKPSTQYLNEFTVKICNEQRAINRHGNARAYEIAVKEVLKFNGRDILLKDISYDFLRSFVHFKLQQDCKINSIGAYLRAIRAIYNEAIKRNIVGQELYPFKRGLVPSPQNTRKKAVSIGIIKALETARETLTGNMRLAVNITLLQFYFRGADFIDVIQLKRECIKSDYVHYERFKNRNKDNLTPITIKLIQKAKNILREYVEGKYLMPILEEIDIDKDYKEIANRRKSITQSLGYVLKRLNINERITSKVIRHTWITIADSKTNKFHLVRYAAGHSSNSITEIYLKYNQAEIDKLNDKVCK